MLSLLFTKSFTPETTSFKIALSDMTSSVIRESLNTLGMDVVNKM